MSASTAVIHVGRLLEVCIDASATTASDIDHLFDSLETELVKLPAGERQYVTVADWSRAPVMSPEASERAVSRLVRKNAQVLKSAAIASRTSPAAVLQALRLIREAQLPDRRLFYDVSDLQRWLEDVLTAPERTRLRAFLAERGLQG